MIATTALKKIANMKQRIRICQGGTSAGKTIAIIMYLITLAQSNDNLRISIVSESVPHLRRGVIRDFMLIMQEHRYFKQSAWNKSDSIYNFANGSYIEFFSADSPDKVRGSRRDILFINECNNVPYATYDQLAVRTKKFVLLDFNPVSEFWVHTEVMPKRPCDFLILTYKDNEGLDPEIVAEIESHKDSPNWWRVFGEGQIGINEGQVYQNWEVIPTLPGEARLERYGADFGFSGDPAAAIKVFRHDGQFIIDEICYGIQIHNIELANHIRAAENLPSVTEMGSYEGMTEILTVADSAEPKSIDEMKRYGVRTIGCAKGLDSVRHGIEQVQLQKVAITERSLNVIKEYRNFVWKVDKNGNPLNTTEHEFSHSMDAIRYAINDLVARPKARAFANKPVGF